MMLNRWCRPKGIVGCVIYLLTDASSYATEAEINIDGV